MIYEVHYQGIANKSGKAVLICEKCRAEKLFGLWSSRPLSYALPTGWSHYRIKGNLYGHQCPHCGQGDSSMRCTTYMPSLVYDSTKGRRCPETATHWMLAPDGRRVPGSAVCLAHGAEVVLEYEAKLHQEWALQPIDEFGNPTGPAIRPLSPEEIAEVADQMATLDEEGIGSRWADFDRPATEPYP